MPKTQRLRRQEFPTRYTKRVAGELLSISSASPAGFLQSKFTCVVSKKTAARAVDRNKLKRRCREVFRQLLRDKQPMVIVAYPKKSALKALYTDLLHEAQKLLGNIDT